MSNQSENKNVYTRKWANFLIFPRFQMALLCINLMILAGSLGIVVFQIKKSWDVFNSFAVRTNLVHNQSFMEMAAEQQSNFYMTLWFSVILGFGVCALFTIIFSHKVVGSMHRLKTYFKEVAENGHRSELTFRDGDLHRDMPEIVNEAIKRIKKDESGAAATKEIS